MALREASRTRRNTETTSVEEEIGVSETVDAEVNSVAAHNNSDTTESSVRSDGLLIDNETIDQLLDSIVTSVQESLSSEFVGQARDKVIDQKSASRNRYLAKRDDEIAGLKAAVSNAIDNGSCSADKMSIVDRAAKEPRPAPESPPDNPRDPRDRRKRLRSSCCRYVGRADIPNSIKSLINELKLTFKDTPIGMGLAEVYSALENHVNKPFDDTWSGVSVAQIELRFSFI